MPEDLSKAPGIISSLLQLADRRKDVILGGSGLWLGTRTETGGAAMLA